MVSVWSEVQTCICPSWCHYHSLSLASVKSRLVLPFWCWLTWVVPEKGPLNGCVCVGVCIYRHGLVLLRRRYALRYVTHFLFYWCLQIMTRNMQHTHTTHNRLTVLFLGLPGWAGTRKVKPIWILLKRETVSSSGISWAICKSAPCSRQTTTPAPHHSFFTGRMPFLPPNQQHQSTGGNKYATICNTKRHILKVTQPGAVDTVAYTQTDLPEGSTTVQPCGAVLYLRFLSLGLVDTYACLVLVSGIGSMLHVWELHCVTHWAMAHSSTQDVWNLMVLQNANLAGLGFCGTAELCGVSIPHGA